MIKFRKDIFVSSLCFLALLAACSPASVQPDQEENSTAVESTQEGEATPIVEATQTPVVPASLVEVDLPSGIELEFWHPWSGTHAEIFENLVEEFNQTNRWNIQVVAQGHGDELVMMEDVNQALEENSLPDIVAAPSQYLRLWDQQSIPIKDLNEYIDSQDLGFDQETLNAFLPVFWKSDVNDDNQRLGVPAYRSGNFLFYNQSWAQDLGFDDYPQTITAFSEQACAAGLANLSDTTVENNGTGGWIYDIQSITGYSWLTVFTGDVLVGEDGNVNFGEDSSRIALESLYDWYAEDCAWTGKQSEPYEYFAKRYALFYSGSNEDIFFQELANQENGNNNEWLMIPYPTEDQRPVVIVDGASYALMGEDVNKNLAGWLFLRFMLNVENQVKIIEETASLPISNTAINLLGDFREAHPAWDQALQSLAFAQSMPLAPEWISIEPVFSDIVWQLRFTLAKENIPDILREAEVIVQEIIAE